jgi:hypothetical protein
MRRVHGGTAIVLGLALVLAGCRFPDGGSTPAPDRWNPIRITAPGDRSQASPSGEVPVDVRLHDRLDPETLRVWVVAGEGWSRDRVEITDRLTLDGTGATALLHATELRPGLTTVAASAEWDRGRHGRGKHDRRHHDDRRAARATSTFSWEPDVDTASADRCDVLAPKKCLMPFPSDFFTVRDDSSATGRRVHFAAGAMPSNASGVPSTRPSGIATTASAPVR